MKGILCEVGLFLEGRELFWPGYRRPQFEWMPQEAMETGKPQEVTVRFPVLHLPWWRRWWQAVPQPDQARIFAVGGETPILHCELPRWFAAGEHPLRHGDRFNLELSLATTEEA